MKGVKKFSINKKNNKLSKFLIGAVVFLLLLIVLNFFISPIKNVFYALSLPIQKVFWSAGESSASFFSSFLKTGFLTKENENLKNENQKLLAQVAFFQSILQGNQAQSDVSTSCQNSGFKLVMAGIVGLDDNDIISINKGSADGISEGMPVISQQNVLFGKIFKVYKNFSQVMLISDKKSSLDAEVQDRDVPGLVKGEGNFKVILDLIPRDKEVSSGDLIISSSLGGVFPPGILIGKVGNIKKNDIEPFQKIEIDLCFDITKIDKLFLIIER